jgi:hypothetical protein
MNSLICPVILSSKVDDLTGKNSSSLFRCHRRSSLVASRLPPGFLKTAKAVDWVVTSLTTDETSEGQDENVVEGINRDGSMFWPTDQLYSRSTSFVVVEES